MRRHQPQSRRSHAVLEAGLSLAPLLFLAVLGFHRRWMSDDAFILVRIVRNLLSGHGPVFNAMERVEAYTSPIWLGILAVCGALKLSIEYAAVFSGLLLTILGLLLGQRAAFRLFRDRPVPKRVDLPLGALVFASIPVVWDFSTSGLETGLVFFWLGLCFWFLVEVTEYGSVRRSIVPAIVMGLGPLIRPDLGLFTVAFILVLFWHSLRQTKPVLNVFMVAGAALLLPALYQVFRMGYFSAMVPNTALAKEAGLSNWGQGWLYMRDYLSAYFIWIPVLALCSYGFWLLRATRDFRRLIVLALYLASLLHLLFVVRVGGDFMHGRLLLPGTLGLLLPVSLVPVSLEKSWSGPWAGIVLAWSVVCALFLRVPYANQVGPHGIADERGFYCHNASQSNPIRVSDFRRSSFADQGDGLRNALQYLERHESPNDPLYRGAVFVDFDDEHKPLRPQDQRLIPKSGQVPDSVKLVASRLAIGIQSCMVGSSVHVVDRHGLADPIASRLRLTVRARPGHEKDLRNAWMIARFADLGAATEWPDEVLAARQVLDSRDIANLLRGIEGPLGPARFCQNISNAWKLRDLRIASDPAEALRDLSPDR
jgi:arabinofuranosyltransferase